MIPLAIVLMIAAHGFMCLLGLRFFRRDDNRQRRTFGVVGLLVGALTVGDLAAVLLQPPAPWMATVAIPIHAMAIALMAGAWRAHRSRPPQYIFSAQGPDTLVGSGPYRWIRHPFYLAYVLTWLASLGMAGGHWALAVPSLVVVVLLVRGAQREEEQFLTSPFADAYRAYQHRTGMLLPRMTRLAPVPAAAK